ncbi:hypothetical protein L1887_62889 [Cichorium endivia]|nr:hypothetical protein L1887_62889 [Cichorium endivia]
MCGREPAVRPAVAKAAVRPEPKGWVIGYLSDEWGYVVTGSPAKRQALTQSCDRQGTCPFHATLEQALKADSLRPKQQRRSAKALLAQIKAEGYDGGYSQLTAFIRAWRGGQGKASQAFVPLTFALGEAFQFDWSEEGLLVGGIYRRMQVAHLKLCASRAFWLVAYPSQGHEMLFDAHTRSFGSLGGVPRRGHLRQHEDPPSTRSIRQRPGGECALCGDVRALPRCRALWSELTHPQYSGLSVAEVLELERAELMPVPAPFDAYVERACAGLQHLPGQRRGATATRCRVSTRHPNHHPASKPNLSLKEAPVANTARYDRLRGQPRRSVMRDLMAELKELRLHGMATAWAELTAQGESNTASSKWLLEHLLEQEHTDRAMRSVSHQMNMAKLPMHRDLAGFDFSASSADARLISELANLSFTDTAQNVVLIGGPRHR